MAPLLPDSRRRNHHSPLLLVLHLHILPTQLLLPNQPRGPHLPSSHPPRSFAHRLPPPNHPSIPPLAPRLRQAILHRPLATLPSLRERSTLRLHEDGRFQPSRATKSQLCARRRSLPERRLPYFLRRLGHRTRSRPRDLSHFHGPPRKSLSRLRPAAITRPSRTY